MKATSAGARRHSLFSYMGRVVSRPLRTPLERTLFALLSMQCSVLETDPSHRHEDRANTAASMNRYLQNTIGGTERVVACLCDALVTWDMRSRCSQRKMPRRRLADHHARSVDPLDPAPLKSDLAAHLATLHEVKRRAAQFDIFAFPPRRAALPDVRATGSTNASRPCTAGWT